MLIVQRAGIAAVAMILTWLSPAAAAHAPVQDLAPIIGTFRCSGRDAGGALWQFRSVNRPWGTQVRADTVFAPQHGQPADYASTYIGFDASTRHWNIVSVDQDGTYFTRYSSSRHFNGARWTDRYPADGATAVVYANQSGYTFELTSRDKNGRSFTGKTVCRRS